MTQAEVLDFLEKHPDRWFSRKDIIKALNLSPGNTKPFKSLRKSGLVDYREAYIKGAMFYEYKHRDC